MRLPYGDMKNVNSLRESNPGPPRSKSSAITTKLRWTYFRVLAHCGVEKGPEGISSENEKGNFKFARIKSDKDYSALFT